MDEAITNQLLPRHVVLMDGSTTRLASELGVGIGEGPRRQTRSGMEAHNDAEQSHHGATM